jgi:death-on-curing protein
LSGRRPRVQKNLHAYEGIDLPGLAAARALGIARNDPFVDENKRTAFRAAYVFLPINGFHLVADEAGAATNIRAAAAGDLSELHFARWLRANAKAA